MFVKKTTNDYDLLNFFKNTLVRKDIFQKLHHFKNVELFWISQSSAIWALKYYYFFKNPNLPYLFRKIKLNFKNYNTFNVFNASNLFFKKSTLNNFLPFKTDCGFNYFFSILNPLNLNRKIPQYLIKKTRFVNKRAFIFTKIWALKWPIKKYPKKPRRVPCVQDFAFYKCKKKRKIPLSNLHKFINKRVRKKKNQIKKLKFKQARFKKFKRFKKSFIFFKTTKRLITLLLPSSVTKVAFLEFKKFKYVLKKKNLNLQNQFVFLCNRYGFNYKYKNRKMFKYSYLTNIFFKKFSILRNKKRTLRFDKFYLPAICFLNYDPQYVNSYDFNNNSFEFLSPSSLNKKKVINHTQVFLPNTPLLTSIKKPILGKRQKYNIFNKPLKSLFKVPFWISNFFIKTPSFLTNNDNNVILKLIYSHLKLNNPFNFSNYFNNLNNFAKQFFFYTKNHNFFLTNVNSQLKLKFKIDKKIIKTFNTHKINILFLSWPHTALIRFLEQCTGKRALLHFLFRIDSVLTIHENSRCIFWAQKLQNFQKTIGNGFFLTESIRIMYISIKLKDPYFLINWMRQTLQKISFWKYRLFFHYLKYVFKYFFWSVFSELKIKGLKFKLKGKVSVSGNARTRRVIYQIGHVSHATYENKILHSLDLVKTFTGVIGLQIWMVF